MRLLLSWLKEFVDVDLPFNELCDVLTLAGLEVDGIDNATFSFKNVTIARVENVSSHPQADRLKVVQVFDGKTTHQVVCGDTQVKAGLIVAFAPVGATLKEPSGKTFKIRKASLRGVESTGMLCAEDELGLTREKSDGIMKLFSSAPIGEDLARFLYDPIIEISLTPNLGHAASVLGIARELSAQLNIPYRLTSTQLSNAKPSRILKRLRCQIETIEACPQYRLASIEGVKVGPSPMWMQERLTKSGINPINNVVDSINYVMLEVGHPMHAFDADCLTTETIYIQKNSNPLALTTLDNQKRHIPPDTLLIYDGPQPIAIAGVMGGESSAISSSTQNIILEAAEFNPSEIRRSTKNLSLHSDSSYRFERGIDPQGLERALDRATALICEIAGGTPSEECLVEGHAPYEPPSIHLRSFQIPRIIGIDLSQNEIKSMLKRLECTVKLTSQGDFTVTPPSYRNDISQEIDLIEEITRLYGFNNIPREPCCFSLSSTPHHPLYLVEKQLKHRLLQEGLQEWITCNLISPALSSIGLDRTLTKHHLISVLHAKSIDQSILRATLLPGMLASIKHNENHQIHDIAAFELGTIHFKEQQDTLIEKRTAGLILCGKQSPHHFSKRMKPADFYDLKGHIENLLTAFGIEHVHFTPSSHHSFHPGRQCEIHLKNASLGVMGEVHPRETLKLDIDPRKRILFAQIDIECLFKHLSGDKMFTSLPQFPGSQRDLTLTLPDSTSIDELYQAIRSAESSHLCHVELIDIFKDAERLGPDKHNITLRFTYRDDTKTIEMKQVDEDHAKITEALKSFT